MSRAEWIYWVIILVLLVGMFFIAHYKTNQYNEYRLQEIQNLDFSALTPLGPKLKLVLHNHPLGGWWLGLTKIDEGYGWWNNNPQVYKLFDQNDVPIIKGSFTYDFRFSPKGTTIVLCRSTIPVVTAMATTGFNNVQKWR